MYLTLVLAKEQQSNDVGLAAILMCEEERG